MKREVVLYLTNIYLPRVSGKDDAEYSVKIVIGDTEYGNMKIDDCIKIRVDENAHKIEGILVADRSKRFRAVARFKIVEVEATTDSFFYSFVVKQKWNWCADCRLEARKPMPTIKEHIDLILDLAMSGKERSRLIELLDQTEYFLEQDRGVMGIYCKQLNEIAKEYLNRPELEKAFEMAQKAESYAEQMIQGIFSQNLKERAAQERTQAMITQAYYFYFHGNFDDVFEILKNCPETVETKLLRYNAACEMVPSSQWGQQSCSLVYEKYQELFSFLIENPSLLSKEYFFILALHNGVVSASSALKEMDGGNPERAIRFLEQSTKLFELDSVKSQICKKIKELRRSAYYGY